MSGWSEVKSKGGKKKKKKGSSVTNDASVSRNQALVDAGVKSTPLDIKPTMYERAEELAAQKERRRQLADNTSSAKESIRALSSSSVTASKPRNSKKKSGRGPYTDPIEFVKTLDIREGLAHYEQSKVRVPKVPLEWLKNFALWCEHSFKECGPAMEYEVGGALYENLNGRQKEKLFQLFNQHTAFLRPKEDENNLSMLFASCADYMVDKPDVSVGILFVLQALVNFEMTQKKSIVVGALFRTMRIHSRDFPNEKIVLPLLRAYSETIKNPSLYLYVWQYLNMQLLLDACSSKVRTACIQHLPTVIPSDKDPKVVLNELKKHLPQLHLQRLVDPNDPEGVALCYRMPLMIPRHFVKMVKLWALVDRQPQDVREQILRVYPYLRELCIGICPSEFFIRLLTVPLTLQRRFSAAQAQLLELLNICMVRDPEQCFKILVRGFEKNPRDVLVIFYHMQHLWDAPEFSTSKSCPARLLQTVEILIAKNKHMKNSNNPNFDEEVFRDADKLLTTIRRDLHNRDESKGFFEYFLISFLMFAGGLYLVLMFHSLCRNSEIRPDFMESICSREEVDIYLSPVDEFLTSIRPTAVFLKNDYVDPARAALVKLWEQFPEVPQSLKVVKDIFAYLGTKWTEVYPILLTLIQQAYQVSVDFMIQANLGINSLMNTASTNE